MTRRVRVLIGAALYCGLWSLTAFVGLPCVDRTFDRQHSEGFSLIGQEKPESVIRIDNIPNPKDLRDIRNNSLPDKPWRYRGRGIAIAPFIIIDEVAWVTAPLGGGAGRRLVVWAFGPQFWFPIQWYWDV